MHNDDISRLLGWPEGVVQEHTRRDGVTGTCATVAEIIPQMPAIMRFKGWTVGATLMEGWLRRPYNNDPEQGIHDSTTVRMAWVLSFPRVREVFDEAVAQKVWVNQAARDEIIDMLKKQHLLPAVSRHPLAPESVRTFGDLPSLSPHPFGASSAPSYLPAFWRASSIVLNPQQMLKLDERYLQHRPHHQTPLVAPMDDLTAALARFDFACSSRAMSAR